MNLREFLDSICKLKRENIIITSHFETRYIERKDDTIPSVDEIHQMLINDNPVRITDQENDKFEILYKLNEEYDFVLLISVESINPEIILNFITCYKRKRDRRVK